MENNAIMQRVMMLSEMWAEAIITQPQARVFAWVGASSVEFKTIKGFVIFQTSMEKTLQDKVLMFTQPFEPERRGYAEHLCSDLHQYFKEWNKDPSLTADTGIIDWEPGFDDGGGDEGGLFIDNMNKLARALNVNGHQEKLTLVLFPNRMNNIDAYNQWLEALIKAGLPAHIRLMLYESRDSMFFDRIAKKYTDTFQYLYPDLDIAGAMNQILEDSKSQKGSQQEKDMLSFQQALIKMNEAIGYQDDEDVRHYRDVCLKLAKTYNWDDQQALVYFFMHTYYASLQNVKKAHEAIDEAISITLNSNSFNAAQTQYQYYIAKGNLHFMDKSFAKAAEVYQISLSLDRQHASPLMLAGIHQMLGNSLRKSAGKTEAWSCFEEGWALLRSQADEELKDNTMAMFYAKDMLSVADQAMLNHYKPQMDALWGTSWEHQLSAQYQEMSKTK
ncbi:hypothetical protein PBAL39_16571 [Pedobacter sp. BAL39]|uniref:hypothetical protein n=1 Tax=Pedobacter sp. BAL39 TaxID=391596 RepID=UPI000155A074|nr:hypothetical protein [Pedobacter sp. BAL39]EDM35114.1 hypothetical protein PBAL39_16571 [Pedobacter sp. BAL39]